jgi:Tfp pilus assembly protein PilZ
MGILPVNQGQREFPRAPLAELVRFFDWNEPFDAQATEIGGGGLFLQTDRPLAEGALLTLRVKLPAGPSFTVLGRVVRTVRGGWAQLRKPGIAVQFMDLSSNDRRSVLAYVARHSAQAA